MDSKEVHWARGLRGHPTKAIHRLYLLEINDGYERKR